MNFYIEINEDLFIFLLMYNEMFLQIIKSLEGYDFFNITEYIS